MEEALRQREEALWKKEMEGENEQGGGNERRGRYECNGENERRGQDEGKGMDRTRTYSGKSLTLLRFKLLRRVGACLQTA